MNGADHTATRPCISLVVSMYGVEAYVGDFLASLEQQPEILDDQIEIVFIDDGSPDASASLVEAWLTRISVNARLIRTENRGLSAARNTGLSCAKGYWVSFPDPDDILEPGYLKAILEQVPVANTDNVGAIAANIIMLDDETGVARNAHPLRKVFSRGSRTIRLDEDPQAVKLQAATTFFRTDVINAANVRFDSRVRPNFEDGAFVARYHSLSSAPALRVAARARYLYRQRLDGSSLVASSWDKREKYVDLPRFGWLETLRETVADPRATPPWLQHIILYDMSWYFRYDQQIHSPTRAIPAEDRPIFMAIAREVLSYIAPTQIMTYQITSIAFQTRMALVALATNGLDTPAEVHIWRMDKRRQLLQFKYYFTGERPLERFDALGREVLPEYAKDRAVIYFGETVMYERILWIRAADGLSLRLNGRLVSIKFGQPDAPHWSVTAADIRRQYRHTLRKPPARLLSAPSEADAPAGADAPVDPAAANHQSPPSLAPEADGPGPSRGASRVARGGGHRRPRALQRARNRLLREFAKRKAQAERVLNGRSKAVRVPRAKLIKRLAKTSYWRSRFAHAWVLMDRDTQAQDNAEHLFRWISRNQPTINAWFVLRRTSPDWQRLKSEGFKLVDFGSIEHTILLLLADHLVSSHVDHYVVHPLDEQLLGRPRWSYTFLQHGVTKDDISRWLNGKPISLIATAAQRELHAFVDDGTPYVLTGREAKLTGFPRHDALVEKTKDARALPPRIVVMPTWREYLMGNVTGRGNSRSLLEDFEDSDYLRNWLAFLTSPRLAEYATKHGLDIVFVPHPNLEGHIDDMNLPPELKVLTYAESDVQEILASAVVLVTDYSSLAFEAAYLSRLVVYFQFDRDDFFARHPHREGYFDYYDDGFGPVTLEVDEAVTATIELLEGKSDRWHEYLRRAQEFFPPRDGQSCARTFEAIQDIRAGGNR